MKKAEKDTFEVLNTYSFQTDNFFLMEDSPKLQNYNQTTTEPAKRLNDYDFNLLKEDAYKDVSDDLFKLEYKISRTENDIKNFEMQIQSAKEIGDYSLIEDLTNRKKLLEEDYEALLAMYNEKSLSARISDKILGLFGNKIRNEFNIFHQKFITVSESIIEKMPKQLSSIFELKKSLLKLENLNKSVDELISMNIPYGENYNKYEQLSKYIIKANSLQAELSRYMRNK